MLIDAWPKMTPTLRDKATTILLSRTDRIAKLLDAIEAKKITPAQLSVAAKATLGRQKTPALAERIAKLIGDGSSSNRKEVIEKYAVAMGIKERDLPSPDGAGPAPLLAGDAARGAKIYEVACMVCHKFADKGNDVGPHLGTIKAWTAEQLVTNILDPNREVSPNFSLYLVETNDGRTLSPASSPARPPAISPSNAPMAARTPSCAARSNPSPAPASPSCPKVSKPPSRHSRWRI
jgi:hypothetical protein